MKFDSEKELEDLLFGIHFDTGLCPVFDDNMSFMIQQFNLPGYGIIDILGVNVSLDGPSCVMVELRIYELKNVNITANDVAQIARYFQGFNRYIANIHKVGLDGTGEGFAGRIYFYLSGVLVGPDYANGEVCWLVDSIPWLSCYHFSLEHTGVKYNESTGWYNKDETDVEIPALGLLASIKENLESCDKFFETPKKLSTTENPDESK